MDALVGYNDRFLWTQLAHVATVLPSDICCIAAVLDFNKKWLLTCVEHKLDTSDLLLV